MAPIGKYRSLVYESCVTRVNRTRVAEPAPPRSAPRPTSPRPSRLLPSPCSRRGRSRRCCPAASATWPDASPGPGPNRGCSRLSGSISSRSIPGYQDPAWWTVACVTTRASRLTLVAERRNAARRGVLYSSTDVTCSDRRELHVTDYHGDTDGVRAARVISMRTRQRVRVSASADAPRWMRRRSRLPQKHDELHVQWVSKTTGSDRARGYSLRKIASPSCAREPKRPQVSLDVLPWHDRG